MPLSPFNSKFAQAEKDLLNVLSDVVPAAEFFALRQAVPGAHLCQFLTLGFLLPVRLEGK